MHPTILRAPTAFYLQNGRVLCVHGGAAPIQSDRRVKFSLAIEASHLRALTAFYPTGIKSGWAVATHLQGLPRICLDVDDEKILLLVASREWRIVSWPICTCTSFLEN
jgi:hypothetical protein